MRDLRHTSLQNLLRQKDFETGEDERLEKHEDLRRNVGGRPLLTDLYLAMRVDPLVLTREQIKF